MSDFMEKLRQQLIIDEGRKPRTGPLHVAYLDTKNKWTTGYGFNLQAKGAAKILAAVTTKKTIENIIKHKEFLTDEEARKILDNQIADAITDARKLVPNFDKLDDPRKLVVACMSFQLGYDKLSGFKATLAAINKGDFKVAAAQMQKSHWAQQAASRVRAYSIAMESGEYPKPPPPRPRRKHGSHDSTRARIIPKENRQRMVRSGQELARQRDLLKEWMHLTSTIPYDKIALAEYWWNVYQTNANAINDQRQRQELRELSQRMNALQQKANELYLKYQQTLQEMNDAQKLLSTLQTIGTLVGIAEKAVSVGKLDGGNDKPASDEGKPETPNAGRVTWVNEHTVKIGEYSEQQRTELTGDVNDLQKLQQQIHDHYRTLGIPLGIMPPPPKEIPLKWPPRRLP